VTLGDRERSGPGDIVQLGEPPKPTFGRLSRLALVCVVVAAVVLVVVQYSSQQQTSPPRRPQLITVTEAGRPILGIRSGYELFGLDGSGVVAVQFARGQIIRTPLPPLQGDGIVSLVAARGEVLVRPLDRVPGYAVPDGKPARPLTGALAHGGILLPGPTSTQQWLNGDYLALVGRSGKAEPAHLGPAVPTAPAQNVIADGRGDLVLTTTSGAVYDAGPGEARPLSALLLAVGMRDWLGVTCSEATCRYAVISAATGASRVLPGTTVPTAWAPLQTLPGGPWPWRAVPGLTAPDGSAAALIVPGQPSGEPSLMLISLSSGAAVRVPIWVGPRSSSQTLAWSPDSRWLFVLTASGQLTAVDPRTGRVQDLRLGLSGLSQIVIRPAAG
jgi:hypothetical protein